MSAPTLVWKNAGDAMGEGDSGLLTSFLPPALAETAFERVKEQVKWSVMHHHGGEVPRLVAVEGHVLEDGSVPIYRHPSDASPPLHPFSPTVLKIKEHLEQTLQQPFNHALIQLYRSGADYISEHADKTIDVDRTEGSKIVNVSLGATRTMILRRKKDAYAQTDTDTADADETRIPREAQRINLPHNSLFYLGLETNRKWLHSIRQDNRLASLKSPDELAFDVQRISLTFRHITTFLTSSGGSRDADSNGERAGLRIYGQGATSKTLDGAKPIISGGEDVSRMIHAFGCENKQSNFDWAAHYGQGFDVLHFTIEENPHPSSGSRI